MRSRVLEFVGGPLGGRTLRSNSSDDEERLLVAACYEMSHAGAIGGNCVELFYDAVEFCRTHGWATGDEPAVYADHRYIVAERTENEMEVVVKFEYRPTKKL